MARERKQLTPHTRMKLEQIVRLQLADKPTEEIATLLNMRPTSVAELMRHPEYETVRNRVVDKVYEPMDKMLATRKANVLLEEAAPDAAEALIALLHSADEMVVERSSKAILDRAGYGPVQRKAMKVRHEIDPATAKLIRDAMNESTVVEVEVLDE